jgi:antitoxin PrlF
MVAATLTEKGQVVIPARIRARYGLTPGTQVEFVDEGGVVRLVVRRKVAQTDAAAGYGMIKVPRRAQGAARRRLSDFDPATLLEQRKP